MRRRCTACAVLHEVRLLRCGLPCAIFPAIQALNKVLGGRNAAHAPQGRSTGPPTPVPSHAGRAGGAAHEEAPNSHRGGHCWLHEGKDGGRRASGGRVPYLCAGTPRRLRRPRSALQFFYDEAADKRARPQFAMGGRRLAASNDPQIPLLEVGMTSGRPREVRKGEKEARDRCVESPAVRADDAPFAEDAAYASTTGAICRRRSLRGA